MQHARIAKTPTRFSFFLSYFLPIIGCFVQHIDTLTYEVQWMESQFDQASWWTSLVNIMVPACMHPNTAQLA